MFQASQHILRTKLEADRDGSDAHSVTSHSKLSKSQTGLGFKPMIRLQNTYKMEPEEGEGYKEKEIRATTEQVLADMLNGLEYDPQSASNLSRTISNMVKDKMKKMNMPRFKFVVSVVIGQKGGQCMKVTSRCMWNAKTDSFTSVQYENNTLAACVTVHGIYMD